MELGVDIVYSKNVTNIQELEKSVSLVFQDSAVAEGDCLIGADGSLSVIRSCIFPGDILRHAGYFAWRGLVPFSEMESGFRTTVESKFKLGNFVIEMTERSHAIVYYLPQGLNWLI